MKGPYYAPGRYWGKVTHQRLSQTKTNKPQLVLQFVVVGRVNPMDPEGDLIAVDQQYERTVFRVLTDKTIDWVLEDLKRLDWTGTRFSQFDEQASDCVSIVGNEASFSCSHEQDQDGVLREKWSVSGPSGSVKALDDKEARKLDAMFGAKLRAAASGKPATKPAAKPTKTQRVEAVNAELDAATDGTPGDIPF